MLNRSAGPSFVATCANLRASGTGSASVASPSVILIRIGGKDCGCCFTQPFAHCVAVRMASAMGVPLLDGSHYAAKRAPDSSEWECINWDAWRNQFLYMFCLRVQGIMANPGARNLKWNKSGKLELFPVGLRMTFACDVLPGRKIGDVIVLEASGNKNFDDLILAGIGELDGASSLEFPPGSTRVKLTQVGMMGVSDRFEFNSREYGDNERTSKTKRSSSNR